MYVDHETKNLGTLETNSFRTCPSHDVALLSWCVSEKQFPSTSKKKMSWCVWPKGGAKYVHVCGWLMKAPEQQNLECLNETSNSERMAHFAKTPQTYSLNLNGFTDKKNNWIINNNTCFNCSSDFARIVNYIYNCCHVNPSSLSQYLNIESSMDIALCASVTKELLPYLLHS